MQPKRKIVLPLLSSDPVRKGLALAKSFDNDYMDES